MTTISQAISAARQQGRSEEEIADLVAEVRSTMQKYRLTESEAIDVVGKKRWGVSVTIDCSIM